MSGIPTIAFARPTSVAEGGVLSASIDLNWMTGLLEPLAAHEEVVLLFVGQDGSLIPSAGAADPRVAAGFAASSTEAQDANRQIADSEGGEYVFAAAPLTIRGGGQEVGEVIAAVPRGPVVAAGQRALLVALAMLGLTATAGVAGALVLNERLILRPIGRLRDAAAGMRDGNLELDLHQGSAGEIGELEQALEQAAAEIAGSRAAIAESCDGYGCARGQWPSRSRTRADTNQLSQPWAGSR